MQRPDRHRRTVGKPLAGLAALSLLLAACGDDDEEAAVVEPVAADEPDELVTPQLDGLEVTVTANVTELIGDHGFQVDKDGLGDDSTSLEEVDGDIDFDDDYFVGDYDLYDYYGYDYDYYDFGYYTAFDDEWDDFDEASVLVVAPGGAAVDVGDAVQVNGTLRYFDESTLEAVYELDLEDDLYGSYERQYVLVADAVKSVAADRDAAASGTAGAATETTTADASGDEEPTTTTEADGDGSAEGSDDSTPATEPSDGDAGSDASTSTTMAGGG